MQTAAASAGLKQPSFGRAKACILLFMWGGPAQQDTWDMKPDAPGEYRGEFKPIATTRARPADLRAPAALAQRADELCLDPLDDARRRQPHHRHALPAHRASPPPTGADCATTGRSYGAVLAQLGRGSGPLPPFVSMMPEVPDDAPRFVEESHGQGGGLARAASTTRMRIDADASTPDYRVGDFALHAGRCPSRGCDDRGASCSASWTGSCEAQSPSSNCAAMRATTAGLRAARAAAGARGVRPDARAARSASATA